MKTETIKKMPAWQYWLYVVVTAIMPPMIILLLANDWRWVEGWIFALWFDALVLSNSIYLYLKNPELLAERASMPGGEGQKVWDKYLMVVIYLLAIAFFVMMPLDHRFGLSPEFALWIKIIGGLALLPALYLEFQSAVVNAYLSTQVKVQKGHKVITTGVYGFVRHPKYLGDLLMLTGAALLTGSLYALLLGLASLPLLIFRILGEEKMLTEELEGYDEYKRKVKYRLLPWVW